MRTVLEARAQARDQLNHPGRAGDLLQGRISDQHSDANVDGVRNSAEEKSRHHKFLSTTTSFSIRRSIVC
jgi:hypothetical protein